MDLVAAGGDRPQFRAEQETAGVRALGHVDDALLPGLYAGAAAFVLPSLYEGFGLTALEALACGVPVVASDRVPAADLVPDLALRVPPDAPGELADALHRALHDDELRRRVAERAPHVARDFSWDRTALATLEVYRRVAAGSPAAAGAATARAALAQP